MADLDPRTERQLAVDLFNAVWALLGRDDRDDADDDRLIHSAHASAYHWDAVGNDANRARAEWQCSRVYATLGRAEPALHHAHRCLAIVERGGVGLEDWDRASALEALARASLLAGRRAPAEGYARASREALGAVTDPEDAAVVAGDLDTLGLD